MKYQVMPDLTPVEYEILKASIEEHGVLVPVEVDEHGELLDGHHRVRAWQELRAEGLNIADYPRLIRGGWTEEQKRNHARRLNVVRRHLSKEQRDQLMIDMRRDGMSYRAIAEAVGVSHETARSAVANTTVKNLTVDLPDRILGKDGKMRPAHRFVSPESPDDTDEYLEQLADDPDGYEWSDETPSSAYCKYCYETHGDWEFEYNDGPSWVCLRCDHRTKGDLVSEPPPTKLPLTASNHKPSETPGYDGDEWYTPAEYIEAARRVLPGGIDLDPASCQEANRVVKARQFFSKDDDGLSRTWHGSVWLNPPYSSPLIQHFIDKLIAEYEQCNVSAAIVLVNNCTDTGWFHRLVSRHPVCFPRGRVQFWRRDSDTQSARQGQAIFYLGKDLDLFVHEFSKFGVVMEKIANVDPK